jgi:hypothetical protein
MLCSQHHILLTCHEHWAPSSTIAHGSLLSSGLIVGHLVVQRVVVLHTHHVL